MTNDMKNFMPRALLILLLLCTQVYGQDLSGIVNINFVPDVRLFIVMAAINAGGFNYESAPSMHPVRLQVRQKLKLLDPFLLQRLHDFYIAHHTVDNPQQEIARYTSLALLLSDPPQLEINLPPKDIPPEVHDVQGFQQILPTFYHQADLQQLWAEVRPRYLAEIEQYKPVTRQSIVQVLQYLRTEARIVMDRQIFFIPDLMSAHGVSNSRIVGSLYYLVVGPAETPEKNLRNIRHEYLHFLLDPLIEKNGLAIVQQQEVLQLFKDRPELLAKYQKDLKLLNTESLIEAIQLRIDLVNQNRQRPVSSDSIREQLARHYDAGNILVYHYYEKLQDFERASASFPEYLAAIIQSLDMKRELQRKEWFVAEAEKLRQQHEVQSKQLQERIEWVRQLERANVLLQQKNFDEAEKVLLPMKERRPDEPAVLFGLGQIQIHRQNASAAESYFNAVIARPEAPAWMVAWSRLNLASVYRATDRLAEARVALQLVASSNEALRGARDEAKKRLADLPPP
jgi:hypothetical protein